MTGILGWVCGVYSNLLPKLVGWSYQYGMPSTTTFSLESRSNGPVFPAWSWSAWELRYAILFVACLPACMLLSYMYTLLCPPSVHKMTPRHERHTHTHSYSIPIPPHTSPKFQS